MLKICILCFPVHIKKSNIFYITLNKYVKIKVTTGRTEIGCECMSMGGSEGWAGNYRRYKNAYCHLCTDLLYLLLFPKNWNTIRTVLAKL